MDDQIRYLAKKSSKKQSSNPIIIPKPPEIPSTFKNQQASNKTESNFDLPLPNFIRQIQNPLTIQFNKFYDSKPPQKKKQKMEQIKSREQERRLKYQKFFNLYPPKSESQNEMQPPENSKFGDYLKAKNIIISETKKKLFDHDQKEFIPHNRPRPQQGNNKQGKRIRDGFIQQFSPSPSQSSSLDSGRPKKRNQLFEAKPIQTKFQEPKPKPRLFVTHKDFQISQQRQQKNKQQEDRMKSKIKSICSQEFEQNILNLGRIQIQQDLSSIEGQNVSEISDISDCKNSLNSQDNQKTENKQKKDNQNNTNKFPSDSIFAQLYKKIQQNEDKFKLTKRQPISQQASTATKIKNDPVIDIKQPNLYLSNWLNPSNIKPATSGTSNASFEIPVVKNKLPKQNKQILINYLQTNNTYQDKINPTFKTDNIFSNNNQISGNDINTDINQSNNIFMFGTNKNSLFQSPPTPNPNTNTNTNTNIFGQNQPNTSYNNSNSNSNNNTKQNNGYTNFDKHRYNQFQQQYLQQKPKQMFNQPTYQQYQQYQPYTYAFNQQPSSYQQSNILLPNLQYNNNQFNRQYIQQPYYQQPIQYPLFSNQQYQSVYNTQPINQYNQPMYHNIIPYIYNNNNNNNNNNQQSHQYQYYNIFKQQYTKQQETTKQTYEKPYNNYIYGTSTGYHQQKQYYQQPQYQQHQPLHNPNNNNNIPNNPYDRKYTSSSNSSIRSPSRSHNSIDQMRMFVNEALQEQKSIIRELSSQGQYSRRGTGYMKQYQYDEKDRQYIQYNRLDQNIFEKYYNQYNTKPYQQIQSKINQQHQQQQQQQSYHQQSYYQQQQQPQQIQLSPKQQDIAYEFIKDSLSNISQMQKVASQLISENTMLSNMYKQKMDEVGRYYQLKKYINSTILQQNRTIIQLEKQNNNLQEQVEMLQSLFQDKSDPYSCSYPKQQPQYKLYGKRPRKKPENKLKQKVTMEMVEELQEKVQQAIKRRAQKIQKLKQKQKKKKEQKQQNMNKNKPSIFRFNPYQQLSSSLSSRMDEQPIQIQKDHKKEKEQKEQSSLITKMKYVTHLLTKVEQCTQIMKKMTQKLL